MATMMYNVLILKLILHHKWNEQTYVLSTGLFTEAIYILQLLRHWWKTICATIYYSWDTNRTSPEAQFYIWPHRPQQTQTPHVIYKIYPKHPATGHLHYIISDNKYLPEDVEIQHFQMKPDQICRYSSIIYPAYFDRLTLTYVPAIFECMSQIQGLHTYCTQTYIWVHVQHANMVFLGYISVSAASVVTSVTALWEWWSQR